MREVLWLGVTTPWGTALKGVSIRKVENHCSRQRMPASWDIRSFCFGLIPQCISGYQNSVENTVVGLLVELFQNIWVIHTKRSTDLLCLKWNYVSRFCFEWILTTGVGSCLVLLKVKYAISNHVLGYKISILGSWGKQKKVLVRGAEYVFLTRILWVT